VTCRPIARKRLDKHVSIEMDSWKPTRYGTRFHGYERSTNIFLDTDALYKKPFRSEARHRKYKRLKLGGGQAYDRSSD
jgi:hypothetical protein